MKNYDYIIIHAKELADMIQSHPITLKYHESLEKIRNDRNAVELLEELIELGQHLNENRMSDSLADIQSSAQYKLIQERLEKNSIVKKHILIQKEYLHMLQQVQERIKNPVR